MGGSVLSAARATQMTSWAHGSGLARRVAAGVLALACAGSVAVLGAPAAYAFGTCSPDWSCLYADNGEQQGIWATNNPEYDVDLSTGDGGLNDRAKSAVNNRSGYMGIYQDARFKGLIACLGPYQHNYTLPLGTTSLRHHADRVAACGAPAVTTTPKPKPKPTRQTPKPAKAPVTKRPQVQSDPAPVRIAPAPAPPPDLALPPLPEASAPPPAPEVLAAPTNVAANAPAPRGEGKDKGIAGALVAAVAAGTVVAALAALFGGALVVRRYRRGSLLRDDPAAALRVDRGLRLLAVDCEQENRPLPVVRMVTIDDEVLTVRLTTPDPDPPQPWRTSRDGSRWILSVSDITELTDDVGATRPYPLLAPVRAGTWVNLAAIPGPISLDGSRRASRRAALSLVRRLRASPWAEGVRIRMIGFHDHPQPPDHPQPSGLANDTGVAESTGAERGRVVLIDEGRQVPKTVPARAVVIAVGKISGVGTTWQVLPGGVIEVSGPPPHEAAAEPVAATTN
jgi:Peptidase inhibitor family I36